MKPLWGLAGAALLGITGAVGAVIVASAGGEEEIVQQAETATPPLELPTPSPLPAGCPPPPLPGATLHRWGDLTIMVPEGIIAAGDIGYGGGPVLHIFPEEINQSYSFQIDTKTGDVTPPEDDPSGLRPKEAEIQAAFATISICPFDPATAPWPYNGEPSALPRGALANISFFQPDPATGMQVFGSTECGISSTTEQGGGCSDFLEVTTARSSMRIDSQSGRVIEPAKIVPEEQAAFDRYLASVQVNGP